MPQRYERRLLDYVGDRRYTPSTLADLAEALQITPDQRERFDQAAQKLLDDDQLVLGSTNTVGLPPPGKEMIGTFRANRRGFGFVIPDEMTAHGDLFVPEHQTGGALNGDHVRAKIVKDPRGRGKQSGHIGRIVEVITRSDRPTVGTLISTGKDARVQLDGRAMPEPVLIRDADASGAVKGSKVVVEILKYPEDPGDQAEGVIVEVLGEAGEPSVETQAVMHAHGLAERFDEEVLAEARNAARRMEQEEDDPDAAPREDLTQTLILTIDPPDAKDFDDAISIRRLEGSNDAGIPSNAVWELGVHIADVAHFVPTGSALDNEAYARGNSTYLPRKVIPMLPEVLSNGVCSLQPEVKRFSKTVFLTYDEHGHVLSQRFARTTIRSAKRFTYLEAQALIDDDLKEARKQCRTEPKYPREIIKALKLMDELAKTIRKRRLRQGMIVLGLPDVELIYDDTGRVIDAQPEDDAFTHTLIEMFMVEANEAAARLFDGLEVPMIRRTHPDPDAHGLGDLRSFARVAGFNIPARPSRQEMQTLLDAVRGKPAQHAVHLAVLRTLSKAEYSPALIGHFALASEHYTHFTSPIRRYTDFVVHRAINAVLDAQAAGKKGVKAVRTTVTADERVPDEQRLTEIGRHCSTTERNSEDAERELRKVLLLEMLMTRLGEDFQATVTGVTGQGAFLQLDKFLVDGFVGLSDLPGDRSDRYRLNRTTGALVAQRSGKTVAIGDRFTARVATVDMAKRELELVIVDSIGANKGDRSKSPTAKTASSPRKKRSSSSPAKKSTRRRTKRKS